jgi:hypothetical protein
MLVQLKEMKPVRLQLHPRRKTQMPMKNRKVSLATAAFIRTLFVQCAADGGLNASWLLNWPEPRTSGVQPIMLQAYFGNGFHHPHLRGATVHDWPLKSVKRRGCCGPTTHTPAIASTDLQNLVFRADYRDRPCGEEQTYLERNKGGTWERRK